MKDGNPFHLANCNLPNGMLCDACCFVKEIPSIEKPRNTRCVYQLSTGGCELHDTSDKPYECVQFHCSTDSAPMNWEYIKIMEDESRVTPEDASAARLIWLPVMP
jgi:hypothetical protein